MNKRTELTKKNENTMTVMNLDDIRNLPPLSSEDWNILNSARPLVSDDCPEMRSEQLKDFRPWYDRQKQSVTLDIDVTVLNFYKHLASENGNSISRVNDALPISVCQRK